VVTGAATVAALLDVAVALRLLVGVTRREDADARAGRVDALQDERPAQRYSLA
jgi:hypothetical protein